MGCNVYANGDEIACKAGDNKVIAAMPDVCLTPPPPPAGPIPIPYPNTSFSKDLQNGSKTVKIGGQEVMLKDQSFHKTSPLGDEAATNGQGAGVITHVITGKTYCVAWSMDVKIEGENVDRHTDLTTSNHASPMANRPVPLPQVAAGATGATPPPPPRCNCCRTRPPHSVAQAAGQEISEAEFYGPQNQALLAEVRAHPTCKALLPTPGSNCSTYYRTQPAQVNAAGASVRRSEARGIRTNEWDPYRPTYYRKAKIPPGTPIGHRVPLAAGGCPIGWGNITPVPPECAGFEGRLSAAQDRASPAPVVV